MKITLLIESRGLTVAEVDAASFSEDQAATRLLCALEEHLTSLDRAVREKWPAVTRRRSTTTGTHLSIVPTTTIPMKA
jgi:hypothetical protein